MPTILIHILNEDPILGEVEQLPAANDNTLLVRNPRRRDGKDLANLQADVDRAIYPIYRIAFIEVMPGEEEERIIGFVRE